MQSRPFSLDGRVAIVTGGGGGLVPVLVTRVAQAAWAPSGLTRTACGDGLLE